METTYNASAAGSISIGGDRPVHRLGFGGMRLTGPGVWGPPAAPEKALAVLHRAVELGVNFIDTAQAYGPDVNEDQIAEALYPYPKDLLIATKGGLTRGGPGVWSRDGRPEKLREYCEGSLKRLRLDRIDLWQLHAVDETVPYAEQIGVIKELQDEGKIRHAGVCNVSVANLRTAQSIMKIVSVQNRYNVLDRQSEDVLEVCEQEGIAFIPWFPLGAGEIHENAGFAKIAREKGCSPYQLALAWLLKRSPVMLPIPGTSSIEHLEENIAAAHLQLTADEFEAAAKT